MNTRMRIVGDLGEKYDITIEDWNRIADGLRLRMKSCRIALQEQHDLDAEWRTVAEFNGAAEQGSYNPGARHTGLQHLG